MSKKVRFENDGVEMTSPEAGTQPTYQRRNAGLADVTTATPSKGGFFSGLRDAYLRLEKHLAESVAKQQDPRR